MKKKIFIMVVLLGYLFSSCTTYKPFMSEASKNPIAQKLPKMEFEWYAGGNVQGANVDFIKNIVRNEINQNITSNSGQKAGKIEVVCEQARLKQNLGWAVLSGGTLFMANLIGLPFTSTKIDLSLSFNILDINGDIIDSYKYSTSKKSAMGLYYGKDVSVCMVEAVKEIMQNFRNDINLKSDNLIAKLEEKNSSSPIYYADGQVPVNIKKKEVTKSDVDQNIPQTNKKSEDTYALIIANEEYQFVDDVNFAAHDGEVFKEYCIKTLGITI